MKTTLDELKAFVAVVDSGSITAAAEALELTISATSRTLARLEDKLQTTLLRRTTRRLELTEEGAAFLEYARTILATVDEAEEQMAARRLQPVGRLRVDAATPFMLHVIVPLLEGFRERYPQVELELNSNEGITDLIEKRTDVAFRIGVLRDSTLHARPIGHSRIRVVASPEYLRRQGTPTRVEQLREHDLSVTEAARTGLPPLWNGRVRFAPPPRAKEYCALRRVPAHPRTWRCWRQRPVDPLPLRVISRTRRKHPPLSCSRPTARRNRKRRGGLNRPVSRRLFQSVRPSSRRPSGQ